MKTQHKIESINRPIVSDAEMRALTIIAKRLRRLYHPIDYTDVNARNIIGDLRDAGLTICVDASSDADLVGERA